MGVALMQAMGPFADGSISNFACNISNYLCTNFGAFIKNCTIDQLINIRSTIYYDLSVYKSHDKCSVARSNLREVAKPTKVMLITLISHRK